MKMQMAEIAKALNTTCEGDDQTVITSVAFDSRKITNGGLFVPLEGERDGHDFVAGAISNGASATLWKKGHPNKPENIAVIEVDDPLSAMQDLARYYLRKVNPTVVGITGSNGKTTTKDMVAAVLSKRFNVHKTQANFNNEIGVPMTILEMKPNTEILVLEMGMDRPGQLHHLSELTHPDVAVITMIGKLTSNSLVHVTRLPMPRWKLPTSCVKTVNLSSTVMNHCYKNVLRSLIKLRLPLASGMKIQFTLLALRATCTTLLSLLTIQSKSSQSQ